MENQLQYDVIRLMELLKENRNNELLEISSSSQIQDIVFLGTIDLKEEMNGQSIPIEKDIYMIIEENGDTTTYRYYDEKQNLIAEDRGDGRGLMANQNYWKDQDLDSVQDTLDKISNLDQEDGLSLEEIDIQLEEYAGTLGVSKDKILAAATIELDPRKKEEIEKSEEDMDKITLEEDEKNKQTQKKNKKALDRISSKAEVNANKTVTGNQTLGKILGLPAGCKLISVYSEHVADNHNTTDFSFLIEYPDGTLAPANMLNQKNGNFPSQNITSINRDGSKVESHKVNSMFSIDSTSDQNDMLTITIGDYGTLDLEYVRIDPTQNRGLGIPLETDNIRPVTSEVKNELNYNKGNRNVTDNLDEHERVVRDCKEVDCEHEPTLKDADGDPNTGHHHIDEDSPEFEDIIDEIMKIDEISETYNRNDVKKFYFQFTKEDPDISLDELKDKIVDMADREHESPGFHIY